MGTRDDVFCEIQWSRSDVARYIAECGGVPTDANIDAAIDMVGDTLQDISIERGWEVIDALVRTEDLPDRPASPVQSIADALDPRRGVEAVPIEFIHDLIEGGPSHWALSRGVFAAQEPGGGFTVVDNSTGDCFTETFATLTGALAYIEGADPNDAYRIDLAQRAEEGRLAPLPLDLIGFCDDVSENGDRLTFRIPATFDTERVFGMRADHIQVDYDMLREEVGGHLMLAQHLEGRALKRASYPLDFEQRLALHQKLNDFCAERFGKGLAAYAAEIDERGFAVFSREVVRQVEDAYVAGVDLDAEARDLRGVADGISDGIDHGDREQNAR